MISWRTKKKTTARLQRDLNPDSFDLKSNPRPLEPTCYSLLSQHLIQEIFYHRREKKLSSNILKKEGSTSFRFRLEQDFRPRQRWSQFFGSVELIDQSRHDKKNISWRKRNWRWTQDFFASKKKMSFFPVLRSPKLFLSHLFPLYLKTDTEALKPPEFFVVMACH